MDLVLDAHGLEPPAPLELTLDALAGLAAADRLILRLEREPYPLYDLLGRLGYRWEVSGSEGDYRILIQSAAPPPGRA